MSSPRPSGAKGQAVTEQEIAEVIRAGGDQNRYAVCREAGATHAEVLEAQRACAGLWWYASCRKAGVTHTEALEARRAAAHLYWYYVCRKAGASHAEAMALRLCALPSPRRPELTLSALRAACGNAPTREIGETIATLAPDWTGTADELATTAVALCAPQDT